ncbi:MAG: DUF3391 domain-containing protein [Burkholderiales bacterium]|nr:DUF3391 domain-containing protein [Burkholderiales bacterium]
MDPKLPRPGEVSLLPAQVRVGHHVRIPLGWLDNPFMTSSFLLRTEQQVQRVRALGIAVYCDPARSQAPVPPLADAERRTEAPTEQVITQAAEPGIEPGTEPGARAEVEPPAPGSMAALQARLDQTQQRFSQAAERAGTALKELDARPQECIEAVADLAGESVETLLSDPNAAVMLMVAQSHQRSDAAHALSVMTMALLMAQQLGIDNDEAKLIAMGAMLHDVGKATLPLSILRKTERNRHEEAVYRQHPRRGHDRLSGLGVDVPPPVLDAVLHHHEQVGGAGFPDGLSGADIRLAARITAIADRFDVLTNPIDPARSMSPFEALAQMWARDRGALDEALLQHFIASLGIYPPGTLVRLNDGRSGVVVVAAPAGARRCPQVLVYDPAVPRRDAQIIDLANPAMAGSLAVEAAMRPQDRPEDELDYLLPRRRMSWYAASVG